MTGEFRTGATHAQIQGRRGYPKIREGMPAGKKSTPAVVFRNILHPPDASPPLEDLALVKPDDIAQLGRADVDRVDDMEVISWCGGNVLMLVDPVQHE